MRSCYYTSMYTPPLYCIRNVFTPIEIHMFEWAIIKRMRKQWIPGSLSPPPREPGYEAMQIVLFHRPRLSTTPTNALILLKMLLSKVLAFFVRHSFLPHLLKKSWSAQGRVMGSFYEKECVYSLTASVRQLTYRYSSRNSYFLPLHAWHRVSSSIHHITHLAHACTHGLTHASIAANSYAMDNGLGLGDRCQGFCTLVLCSNWYSLYLHS